MKTIVLDAGHGGNDPGATANNLEEKNITLDIVKRMKDYLTKQYDCNVILTRTTDIFIDLDKRNTTNSDIFVSIHINAGNGTGFESFVNTNATKEALTTQHKIHESMQSVLERYNLTDRGKKKNNFAVLRGTTKNCILLETFFIDRATDAKLLKTDQFLQDVSIAYSAGIAKSIGLEAKDVDEMFLPSSKSLKNSVLTVLKRLECKDNGISSEYRQRLLNEELTVSDAIALIYVALDRELLKSR